MAISRRSLLTENRAVAMANLDQIFWPHVVKNGEDECWPWTGPIFKANGRGYLVVDGEVITSSRLSWIVHFGEPGELQVFVDCKTPNCVNSRHLHTDKCFFSTPARSLFQVRGEQHGMSKLSPTEVLLIRELLDEGHRQVSIAQLFGIRQTQVSNIKTGKHWKHLVSPPR